MLNLMRFGISKFNIILSCKLMFDEINYMHAYNINYMHA